LITLSKTRFASVSFIAMPTKVVGRNFIFMGLEAVITSVHVDGDRNRCARHQVDAARLLQSDTLADLPAIPVFIVVALLSISKAML
jgi:hypothetical protein